MKGKRLSQPQKFQIGLRPYKNRLLLLLVLLITPFFLVLLSKDEKVDHFQKVERDEEPSHIACPYENFHYEVSKERLEKAVKASAVIVPHHLLAGELVNNTLSRIDPNYETIILVGPNHKGIGKSPVQASSYIWQTKFGLIDPDIELMAVIKNNDSISISEDYFDLEHSICGLVTFLKKYFPDAKLLPLMLRNDISQTDILAISKTLSSKCSNCLVIASVDFSHEAPVDIAAENDIRSTKLLREKNPDNIEKIISDCNLCLAFLYGFLDENDELFVVNNSNSYSLSGVSANRVTSYIAAYYTRELIKILFAGDLMFDRNIRKIAQVKGYDFILEGVKEKLQKSDLVVANLEGTITDFDSVSLGSGVGTRENYFFTFDKATAKTLKEHNIRLVNIGNNHINDFGREGLDQTLKNLKGADIEFFGNTGTNEGYDRFKIVEIEGVKIAIVNYNQFAPDPLNAAMADIEKAKKEADIVILYAHWGEEYVAKANEAIQNLAHAFIDKGVDLIIGSHPHVIQQVEEYKDKFIYYSLGNFVFDQYFSEDTKKGLLVKVSIDKNTLDMEFEQNLISLEENGQTRLLDRN